MLVMLLVAAVSTSALAGGPKVGITAGKGYDEYAARWWQWMTSIPTAVNPQNHQGAVDCTLGQQGPVWFLAGAPTGVTAERSCTVPRNKPLFFPLLNAVFINGQGETFTVAERRDALDGLLNDTEPGPFADFGFPGTRACELFVEIDGLPVTYFRAPDMGLRPVERSRWRRLAEGISKALITQAPGHPGRGRK